MLTKIKPELSKNNKYWISKHRYYELKYYCLQYPTWKKTYLAFDDLSISLSMIEEVRTSNLPGDPTAKRVIMKAYFSEKMKMLEDVAKETDKYLHEYILKAVTENLSYNTMLARYEIPCGRDMFYDRVRKFYWILDKKRN